MYNPEKLQDNLLVTFEDKDVYMKFKSEEAGEAIHEPQLYVHKVVPFKEKDSIFKPATEKDKKNYPEQYAAYKNRELVQVSGYSIKNWNFPSDSQIKMLMSHKVQTIQQVAALDDIAVKRMGAGGRLLRDNARKFVEQNEDLDGIKEEIEALKKENVELKAKIKELEKDDTTKRNPKRSKRNGASSTTK